MCAQALDDKRLNKMIVETAQLLCTAIHEKYNTNNKEHHLFNLDELAYYLVVKDKLYKATHKHHPCTKWVILHWANYHWLYVYWLALVGEYKHRFGKTHKTYEKLKHDLMEFDHSMVETDDKEPTPFVNCTPYKDEPNIFIAYRKCLIEKWKNDKLKPKWTKTAKPIWSYDYGLSC
jgi:hypothetical protein